MNILMVNYEYPPLGGGGGVFNKQLAEELSMNHNITVVTTKFSNHIPHEVVNRVELIRVPVIMRTDQNAATILSMLSFFPASFWAGYKQLKNKSFDIIHSMFAIPSAPSAVLLSKKFHVPHVLSILGGDIYDPSKKLSPHKAPILHYTVKRMMEESDKVVALSHDIKKRAIDYYCASKNIDVIHLGIPKPVFKEKGREYFGFEPNDILLITVGRLVPRKALQDLIRVIGVLKNPNIKLVVIGDGPERKNLVELASSLNVSDRVIFSGYISDEEKFQLLNISDIYASSSQHEGFGIVFLEAMALSLPIVCYDSGGQTDFLIDGKTGFLVDCGDREMLTKRIQALCQDVGKRKKMSEHNSKYIEDFYIGTCAKKYLVLYESLVSKTYP